MKYKRHWYRLFVGFALIFIGVGFEGYFAETNNGWFMLIGYLFLFLAWGFIQSFVDDTYI